MSPYNPPISKSYIIGVLIEAQFYKLLEEFWEVPRQLWGVVLGDQEQDPHGMEVWVWGFPFGQFYGCDS